jgi:hypothetical protein
MVLLSYYTLNGKTNRKPQGGVIHKIRCLGVGGSKIWLCNFGMLTIDEIYPS